MKLQRKDIKKVAKVLEDIPYNPVKENCLIVVPIETDKVAEFNGIELTLTDKENGVKKAPTPVLLMNYDSSSPVLFGYADITFARRFDLFDYCELLNFQYMPKNMDALEGIDVLLVDKQNVLMSFEL